MIQTLRPLSRLLLASLCAGAIAAPAFAASENNSADTSQQSDPASLNNRGSFQTGNTMGSDTSSGASSESGTTGTDVDTSKTDADSKGVSPRTQIKGTSGEGPGAADPTYGGETGTTENTASPHQPKKKKRAKAKGSVDAKTSSYRAPASSSETERVVIDRQSLGKSSGLTLSSESSRSLQDEESADGSQSQATSSAEEREALSSPSAPIDWKANNPARPLDPLLAIEPYSRQPQQIGSVQVTGKDKSVAVLEQMTAFVDPNAMVRNELAASASRPANEFEFDRYEARDKRALQSALKSRLNNLAQNLGALEAEVKQDAFYSRSGLREGSHES